MNKKLLIFISILLFAFSYQKSNLLNSTHQVRDKITKENHSSLSSEQFLIDEGSGYHYKYLMTGAENCTSPTAKKISRFTLSYKNSLHNSIVSEIKRLLIWRNSLVNRSFYSLSSSIALHQLLI